MTDSDTRILEFENLFKKYHDDLFGYGMKLCGNRELVKDQIQELFISLWNRSAPLSQIESKKSYLLISLKRRILKKIEQESGAPTGNNQWEKFASFSFNAEEIIIREEMEENRKLVLQEALNQLPERQREVVYLRFYRGLTYEELEEVLFINYQSAVNHVYRAKKKLQSIVKNHQTDILLAVILISRLALPV